MKKLVLVIFLLVTVVYLAGCGKKQTPISEIQEPISIEELSSVNTQPQAPAEVTAKAKPQVSVPGVEAKLEPLPPSGPYKPTATEIQTALKNAGYYSEAIDGKIGPKTKKAIEEFQKASGLKADGKVGLKTWGALSKYLNPTTEKKK